jgi:hypothetical protein
MSSFRDGQRIEIDRAQDPLDSLGDAARNKVRTPR